MNTARTARLGALTILTALVLAGCSSTGSGGASQPADEGSATAAENVSITDAWVKAADSGMSAAFGVLENAGDEDATVVSVTTEASSMVELHETVANDAGEMVMRQIDGGFVVPADGSLTLEPGADHIMLMDLTAPLVAGDEVSFTVTFSDDSSMEFSAPVKDYSGANENYEGGDDMDDMGDMDH